MKLLFLLLLSFSAFAQNPYEIPEEEINPETQDVLIKQPEKYLQHESMIYDLNTDLGIKDQRKYTGTDRNRLSATGMVSADYEHFNDLVGLDVTYMRRTERYNRIWYGLQLFQNRTYFDSITQNQPVEANDGPGADSSLQRPNNTKANLFGAGLGMSYRFKLLLDFFSTEDVFENIDVFANYVTMDDQYIKKKYTGYGLTTNYGIHKRSSTNFFYGGKLSYNLATVTREQIEEESKSDRSFVIGWLAVGFEIGFFY